MAFDLKLKHPHKRVSVDRLPRNVKFDKFKPTTMGFISSEIDNVLKNLTIVEKYFSISALHVISGIAIHLLATSLPRTPWETGALRKSGTAMVKFGGKSHTGVSSGLGWATIVGKGNKDGTITTFENKLRFSSKVKIPFVSAVVSFARMGEDNLDVAVWTHEDLLPFEGKAENFPGLSLPTATKPGTGPKYLENAYNQNETNYVNWIRGTFSYDEIAKDIQSSITVVAKRAKSKFKADQVKIGEAILRDKALKKSSRR